MILAAFGDVGGNLPALRAVLDAIESEGIHTIINTGGSVTGYPQPGEVIDLLLTRSVFSLQDETDRRAARYLRRKGDEDGVDGLRAAHEAMRSDHVEYLLGLPRRKTLVVDGIAVFCAAEGLRLDDAEHRFQRLREEANAGIIVCGHSASGYARQVDTALFVDPGSMSAEPGVARYAVIEAEEPPWDARLCTVRYK